MGSAGSQFSLEIDIRKKKSIYKMKHVEVQEQSFSMDNKLVLVMGVKVSDRVFINKLRGLRSALPQRKSEIVLAWVNPHFLSTYALPIKG